MFIDVYVPECRILVVITSKGNNKFGGNQIRNFGHFRRSTTKDGSS